MERSTAHAPATCGAAIDVPLKKEKPVPGTDELIEEPGASRFKNGAELENEETVSNLVVEPTLTAEEMQPGEAMAVVNELFPDEITVAIPAARRLSIAAFRATLAASQSACVENEPPPRLMLTEAMVMVLLSARTRSKPRIWSERNASAHGAGEEPQSL